MEATTETEEVPQQQTAALKGPANKPSVRPGAKKKRKKKFVSSMNMWIRRIHLFSGLFMLPWVLLYGFTALLFNHPTVTIDSQTQINNFALNEKLPAASTLAQLAVLSAQEKLESVDGAETIEYINPASAVYTRKAFGTLENAVTNLSLVLDLNSGSGYLRQRAKKPEVEAIPTDTPQTLKSGLSVTIDKDPIEQFRQAVRSLLDDHEFNPEDMTVRTFPTVEFDALVDGRRQRVRFSYTPSRGRPSRADSEGNPAGDETGGPKREYAGKLDIVGNNPRDLSLRSYLLRLHMAHGYPVQKNHRWFWAIAVDLMFASMVFWGLSGVVMWWQIKRTRRIGLLLLIGSALVATWLASGRHWELVHG